MTIKELTHALSLELLAGTAGLHREAESVFCCDLLSFAMGRAPSKAVWITVMGNANAVLVAQLADVACIVLAEGFQPAQSAIDKANRQAIPILRSRLPVYETAREIAFLLQT